VLGFQQLCARVWGIFAGTGAVAGAERKKKSLLLPSPARVHASAGAARNLFETRLVAV